MNSYDLTYPLKYESLSPEDNYQAEPEETTSIQDEKVIDQTLVKKYFQELHKIPLLLHSEELELARMYKQSLKSSKKSDVEKAIKARNRLILGNLRLVVSLAKRYASSSRIEITELIQEGNLGLLKAAEKYDPEMGYRFSTYATWWIRQSILSGIAERTRLIRLPASVNELLSKIRKTKEDLPKLLGREATLKEICEVLEVPQPRISTVLALEEQQEQIVHFDSTYQSDDYSETSLLETICSDQENSTEEEIDHKIIHNFLEESIVNALNEREALIVRMRYGFNSEDKIMTLTELSKILKISLERVRQIELKALGKLKSCVSLQFGEGNLVAI